MTGLTLIPALMWGERFPHEHRRMNVASVEDALPIIERFAGPFGTKPFTTERINHPDDPDEFEVTDAKGYNICSLHAEDIPDETFGEAYPEAARMMTLDDTGRW